MPDIGNLQQRILLAVHAAGGQLDLSYQAGSDPLQQMPRKALRRSIGSMISRGWICVMSVDHCKLTAKGACVARKLVHEGAWERLHQLPPPAPKGKTRKPFSDVLGGLQQRLVDVIQADGYFDLKSRPKDLQDRQASALRTSLRRLAKKGILTINGHQAVLNIPQERQKP